MLNSFDQVDTHLILLNNFDQVDTHSCLQALSDKLQPQIRPIQSFMDDLNGLQVLRLNKTQTLTLSPNFDFPVFKVEEENDDEEISDELSLRVI